MKNYHKAVINNNGNIRKIDIINNKLQNEKKNTKKILLTDDNIMSIIDEIIKPENVDISSIIIHNKLNPIIWNNDNTIKPEIKKILYKNIKRFIDFLDLDDIKIKDIILTGSMANYNYNENSDIDIHIITDFSKISNNKDFVENYFKMKKNIWNEKINPKIKNHEIEIYVQDVNEILYASGTYSLIKNKWLMKPIKKIITIDKKTIQKKVSEFINKIEELESKLDDKNWLNYYKTLKDKLKKYRKIGLENNGEFSTENLVFKILRNSGYINKLNDLKNDFLKNELSLKEIKL